MTDAIVIGGGLAGLSATAALAGAGYSVELFESRAFLGGRATSFPLNGESGEVIDNCQHILLGCCVNLMDFYRRLNVAGHIRFDRAVNFLEPGGRLSRLEPGWLPAPMHLAGAFLRLPFLALRDKLGIARALRALQRQSARADLDTITMLEWLQQQSQTPAAIERFWRQVLVSAINEELDRMSALHGFQVFRLGFLAGGNASDFGVPTVPLADLYAGDSLSRLGRVRVHAREPVERIPVKDGRVVGVITGHELHAARFYVCALPLERTGALLPSLGLDLSAWEHSPITGIHLWFDRSVTDLPHAALLGRTMQWFFNKAGGRYLMLVVSASRSLVETPRAQVVELAVHELAEFLPAVRGAKLEKAHVVKEVRATFSARPGLEALRPPQKTHIPNLFLAGDWTRSGWPATMEGAVRSGYLAAEALSACDGRPRRFLLPDVA